MNSTYQEIAKSVASAEEPRPYRAFLVVDVDRVDVFEPSEVDAALQKAWVDQDGTEASDEKAEKFDRLGFDPDGLFEPEYFLEQSDPVTVFFTRKAANDYVNAENAKGRNLRVVAINGGLSAEWVAVWNALCEAGRNE